MRLRPRVISHGPKIRWGPSQTFTTAERIAEAPDNAGALSDMHSRRAVQVTMHLGGGGEEVGCY